MSNLICSACDGSGEGQHEGTTCRTCNGLGTVAWERDDAAEVWADDERDRIRDDKLTGDY